MFHVDIRLDKSSKPCLQDGKSFGYQNCTKHAWPYHAYTVQTINSCTSRPDVCQHLIVQTPNDN